MDLSQRILKLNPHQRRLLELKMKQQEADIYQIPITQGYRENYPGRFPLSLEQEPMWVIEKLDPDNPSYSAPGTVSMHGNLKPDLLEKSINEVVKRHEVLRTVFITDKDKPVQVIQPSLILPLERIDLKDLPPKEQENRLKQVREDKGLYTFDIAVGPLVKTLLLELSGNKYILITIMHHIISDLLSLKIFLKEVSWNYRLFLSGTPPTPPLPVLSFQYVDYACWQQYWFRESILGINALEKQEKFWMEMFREEAPILNLPVDYARPALKSYEGDHLFFEVSGEEIRGLKQLLIQENTTLYVILLTMYYVFLAKISGQEDIVVGTPVNARHNNALNNMIGFFVRTVPLRSYPRGGKTFTDLLTEVNALVFDMYKNQDYPYEELVRKFPDQRDPSRNPLFDVLFNFIYLDMNEIHIPGLKMKPYRLKPKRTGFDLELVCEGTEKELFFKFSYSSKLFKEETVHRFVTYFKKVVETVIKKPGVKISGIGILTEEEKKRLVYEFNETAAPYPKEKTIHQLFVEQVETTPHHVAISGQRDKRKGTGKDYEDYHEEKQDYKSYMSYVSITYRQLNEKSSRLAYLLKKKGVRPDTIVGIMVERSLEMIIGILGILKSGGAYLPIDPDYPQDRIDYMLTDSNVKALVVVDTSRVSCLSFVPKALLNLSAGRHLNFPASQLPASPASLPSSMAYVIYTSGSTGKPKGVVILHQALVNFAGGMAGIIDFQTSDRVLSLTTISFDIFGLETFVPLICGAAVVMGSREHQLDPGAAARVMVRQNISIFQVTPSRLRLFLSHARYSVALEGLRYLLVGGEAFPQQLLNQCASLVRGRIINLYGPTETTIWSTACDVTGGIPVNIGKPIVNTFIYILDRHLNLVPIGRSGHIYIGGHGLSRGYLNNPALTFERFIEIEIEANKNVPGKRIDPHMSYKSHKSYIYKTGDIGCWLSNGDILCLGREDLQVKIRGFRVELEEIEKRLAEYQAIKEAVVIVREDGPGNRVLCAFYVPEPPGRVIKISQLREFLSAVLPDYMIPSYFMAVEHIPLTPNKKIDRKALAVMKGLRRSMAKKAETAVPQTGLEKKIARCWRKVLQIDNIGIDDQFFELGGNSMSMIQLGSELSLELGRDIPVVSLFRYLTIRSFVRYMVEQEKEVGQEQVDTEKKNHLLRRKKNILKTTIKKTMRGQYARHKREK